jgi:hypothetical protein
VDGELGARAALAHPVRVHVPSEEDDLEEEDARGPGGRRATHARQEHSCDHRLDDEEEAGAEEGGQRPEGAHQSRRVCQPARVRVSDGGTRCFTWR